MSIMDEKDNIAGTEYPEIELHGKVYTLKPLGLELLLKIARIITKIFKRGTSDALDLFKGGNTSAYEFGLAVFMFGLEHAEEDVIAAFAYTIGVSPKNMIDLPINAPLEILDAIQKHPDVDRFVEALGKLKENQMIQDWLQKIGIKQS